MSINHWGGMTPQQVSGILTFDRGDSNWTYKKGDTSMPARQAEGVAGLWEKLDHYGAALLADEVGTGKTLQALGVMALLWRMHPGARVLVMAPNRDICQHWDQEYRKFIRAHYRESDGRVRSSSNEALHPPQLCWRLEDLATAVEQKKHHFFITTIYSLSGLVRGVEDKDFDKLKGAARIAASIHSRIKQALNGQGFDLVIVDEAHYFRNSEGNSQRARAASEFFGPAGDRLGARTLLMTATPSHKSMQDVPAILGYITDVGKTSPEALLKKYALRRLRRMQGQNGSYDKYSYRKELAVSAEFKDPAAELFFALYQKLLVQQHQQKNGKRFLYGYLEGFESFEVQPPEALQNPEEEINRQDFKGAPDTEILKRLAQMHESLGGLPAHPKYDTLVNHCMPVDLFDAKTDIHEYKHLIFVRRIPSVREITKRMNTAYDKEMARKIIEAWAPENTERFLKQWGKKHWSRDAFNQFVNRQRQTDDTALPDIVDEEPNGDEHADNDTDVHSQVANLFAVKKIGKERSTDCSNFSLRLRKAESMFSLLLEPASDYKSGTYNYYYHRQTGDRQRDEYAFATQEARGCAEAIANTNPNEQRKFSRPMQTLWGLIYPLLSPVEQEQINKLVCNKKQAEQFAHYIRNGFLFASPVIVELYCWYVRCFKFSEIVDVQQRYRNFLAFIDKRLKTSMVLAYFRAALETYDMLSENWEKQRDNNWSVLKGLSSPAFYASSGVTDRQRLIFGFNSPFYPNVLTATSVLQEGVNLHIQCRKVHHYGIAWTPGDNEQRVGRVDRLFGKINNHLQQKGSAELAIHYPYLAHSFDEEQLASFIRHKYLIEERLDACRDYSSNNEIDLRNVSGDWELYLRKPRDGQSVAANNDPFPYSPLEAQPE